MIVNIAPTNTNLVSGLDESMWSAKEDGGIHDTRDIMRLMNGFDDSIKGVSLWPVLSRNMVAAV